MSTWFDMGIESINTQSSLFHQIWKLWLCTVNGDGGESCSTSQMNDGKTTIIEIMCTRELGDPFRRDALSSPIRFLDKYKDYV
jgi:hypothetical protein